jgi:hypothetical protein
MARNSSGSKGIGILNRHKQKRPPPDYINQMAARPSVQLSISILKLMDPFFSYLIIFLQKPLMN